MTAQRRGSWKRIWPLTRIALLLIFTLAITVSVLLGAQWLPLQNRASRQDMEATAAAERGSPEKLLLLLAGTPAGTLAQEAIVQRQWNTAHAILVWALDIPEEKRIQLLQAAISGQPPEGPLTIQERDMLYASAILLPHISDRVRLRALLFLLPSRRDPAARQALIHSILAILSTSPTLRAREREDALNALRLAGVDTRPIPRPLHTRRVSTTPVFHIPLSPPSLPEDVRQATKYRQQLARALAQNPQDARIRRRLAAALRAESLARENFFANALASTPTPEDRLKLAWDRLRWATYRDMIAQHAFSISLVPEWEFARKDIHMRRIKAWETFVGEADDWVLTQPDIVKADQGAYELWQWIAWAGEVGMYPRYPRQQVQERLQEQQKAYVAHPEMPWRPWITWDKKLNRYILTDPLNE